MKITLMNLRPQKQNDQSGMASFLIVAVIVMLLALLSLGFSTVANREARQALDRQLSDEAYYAAESGINDAQAWLATYVGSGTTPNPVTTCGGPTPTPTPNPFSQNGNLDSATATKGQVRYSCVLIDTQPAQLTFKVPAGQTKSFPVRLTSPDVLDKLYISWQNDNVGTSASLPLGGFHNLPQDISPPLTANTTGVLRVGVYPVDNAADTGNTNQYLTTDLATYFLYPNLGAGTIGSVSYSPGGSAFIPGNCNPSTQPTLPDGNTSKYYCNARIDNLNPNKKLTIISLTAMYKDLTVSIEATQNGTSGVRQIPNVQAVIDSTGAGNDVLRRIRAAAPLQRNINYGIQSIESICKLFRVPVNPPSGGVGQYGTPQPDGSIPSASNNSATCPAPTVGGAIH